MDGKGEPLSDTDIKRLARVEPEGLRAPSRLKARIYSRLLVEQARDGELRGLSETRADGRGLCVWERLVQIAPAGETIDHWNFCSVCHARLLAEHFENPPLRWRNCPYSHFGDV